MQVSSDREESLSDPRWHKKPPAKGKKITFKKQANTESTTPIQDARELIQKAEETRKKSNFPKIGFSDNTETRRKNQTAQKKTET